MDKLAYKTFTVCVILSFTVIPVTLVLSLLGMMSLSVWGIVVMWVSACVSASVFHMCARVMEKINPEVKDSAADQQRNLRRG